MCSQEMYAMDAMVASFSIPILASLQQEIRKDIFCTDIMAGTFSFIAQEVKVRSGIEDDAHLHLVVIII